MKPNGAIEEFEKTQAREEWMPDPTGKTDMVKVSSVQMIDIPHIDPRVKYLRVHETKGLNATALAAASGPLVLQNGDSEPLAVVIPWEMYMRLQTQAQR